MSTNNKSRIVAGVKLGLILVSPEWQPRAALDTEHVLELHEAVKSGRALPPLDVVEMDDGYALVDGYHRHAAMLAVGSRTCEVRVLAKGDRDAARWWSYAANRAHGLKRTAADKRRTVRECLAHAYASDMSNNDLAEHCGVGLTLIADVRKEMSAPSPKEAASERAAAAVAAMPGASTKAIAKAAGVHRDAVRSARGGVASTAANDPTPPDDLSHVAAAAEGDAATPTLAERHAAHVEVARIISKCAKDVEIVGGGLLASHVMQGIDGLLRKAEADAKLSAPVSCPRHNDAGVCMTCRGAGWVTQATANQIERAS